MFEEVSVLYFSMNTFMARSSLLCYYKKLLFQLYFVLLFPFMLQLPERITIHKKSLILICMTHSHLRQRASTSLCGQNEKETCLKYILEIYGMNLVKYVILSLM